MSVKVLVIASDPTKVTKVRCEDFEVSDVLGKNDDAIGLRIDEIVRSVSESVRASISSESELTVEINGSVSLKGEGNVKWLFFNVGATATAANSLRVSMKTKISPDKKTE